MILPKTNLNQLLCLGLFLLPFNTTFGQQVTGFWKGKIDQLNVEVKIIQKGDSLTGSSYYYQPSGVYQRYSIRGYFDAQTNSVVWWDDQLISNKKNANSSGHLSVADFNCPGGGAMTLDGKSAPVTDPERLKNGVSLTKVAGPTFPDEWDFVIDNYTVGANDPDIIDSIGLISFSKPAPPPVFETPAQEHRPLTMTRPPVVNKPAPAPMTIEEKFKSRTKIFSKEIVLEGDSIELRFYDNAEVDGDSISLFINDHLLFSHVKLTDKAYTIKLPVKDISDNSELVMVAENLGSIPPNTSYMVAITGDKRYDAQLASTENTSAMIRLMKPAGK